MRVEVVFELKAISGGSFMREVMRQEGSPESLHTEQGRGAASLFFTCLVPASGQSRLEEWAGSYYTG